MNRSVPLVALSIGLLGAALAPRFGPTATFSPLVAFLVCSLGAVIGLWTVRYALTLEARR